MGHDLDTALNRQNRPAGFGLPIVIHYRLTNSLMNPGCGWFIQRFASQKQGTQAR